MDYSKFDLERLEKAVLINAKICQLQVNKLQDLL